MRDPGSLQVAASYGFRRDQVFFFNPCASTLKEHQEEQIPAISKQFQHYRNCSSTFHTFNFSNNAKKPSKTLIFA